VDVIAVRGQSARLDCLVADGNSSSSDFAVHWFQDGLPVVLQPDQRRQILANGSLYFDKVNEPCLKFGLSFLYFILRVAAAKETATLLFVFKIVECINCFFLFFFMYVAIARFW